VRFGLLVLTASAFLASASLSPAPARVIGAGFVGDETSTTAINATPRTDSGMKFDAAGEAGAPRVASCRQASLPLDDETGEPASSPGVSFGSLAATVGGAEAPGNGATVLHDVLSRITLAYAVACVVGTIVFAMWGSLHSKQPFGN
jgi:hypothetical protein